MCWAHPRGKYSRTVRFRDGRSTAPAVTVTACLSKLDSGSIADPPRAGLSPSADGTKKPDGASPSHDWLFILRLQKSCSLRTSGSRFRPAVDQDPRLKTFCFGGV